MKRSGTIWIYILIFLLPAIDSHGQTLTERLIVTDTEDSLLLHAHRVVFGSQGDYCFTVIQNRKEYFITNRDTIGGFDFIGGTYGSTGEIRYTESDSKPNRPFYYKNARGTKVYEGAVGRVESFQTSNTLEHIGLITVHNDSAYYYANGELLHQSAKTGESYRMKTDWIAFSENGNVIFFLAQGDSYHLYVNHKRIDSSKFKYTQLAINNYGRYVFAKGEKPEQPFEKYDYLFHVHRTDTVIGYARTVWNYALKDNGAYYYSGHDIGGYYMIINDQLHKGIQNISNKILASPNAYFYSFEEKGLFKVNANGRIYTCNFEKIFSPTIDYKGNFAFFGIRDYYLYKYVNGVEHHAPLSRYGVRAMPLDIGPSGEALHYFRTDDSVYLYKDDELIFPPVSKDSRFIVKHGNDVLSSHYNKKDIDNAHRLYYIEYDRQGYFVFNGTFSQPMLPVKEEGHTTPPGAIVSGILNDDGFFVIQKTDEKKYLININNVLYQELGEIDHIVDGSVFLDQGKLTFYGVRNRSFYQFQLSP